MNILLTGGAGYIGSTTANLLLDQGATLPTPIPKFFRVFNQKRKHHLFQIIQLLISNEKIVIKL